MGRGHNPNVHFLRLRAAQALEFPLLQHAQEFRLQIQRDIADFVQKQCALVGQFQPAGLLGHRPGEGAALMPKKFALQQSAGNGSAVELNKCLLPAGAAIVDGVRDQFLAAPVSPNRSTVDSLAATMSTSRSTSCKARL